MPSIHVRDVCKLCLEVKDLRDTRDRVPFVYRPTNTRRDTANLLLCITRTAVRCLKDSRGRVDFSVGRPLEHCSCLKKSHESVARHPWQEVTPHAVLGSRRHLPRYATRSKRSAFQPLALVPSRKRLDGHSVFEVIYRWPTIRVNGNCG